MASVPSDAFVAAARYGVAFSNEYLLKHGNFFLKPALHPEGFVFPAFGEAARFFKGEPLNFVKQEKPPTPPISPPEDPLPQILNGTSKHSTWILGKQKLSWDNSIVASYNPDTKMFRCVVCNAVGFLSRIAEHYLGTHTSAKVFQCLHCPYSSTWSRCVRMHMAKHHGVPNAPPSLWKGQPLLEEIFQLLTNLKATVDSQGRERLDPEQISDKKFVCPKCPYTTDRRDLYLRHENIHKEDKPYHCYICFKLFNRADHVKKHFLRIHRGHPYDISLVRRRPPRTSPPKTTSNSNNFSVDKLIATKDEVKSEAMDLSIRDTSSNDSGSSVNNNTSKQLKTFQCSQCEWEGVDSWCLRRHMNVHLKDFECTLCEFKGGKAERLFTHVYRAHKKLTCTKCRYLTDLAQDFEGHIKECCMELAVGNLLEKLSEDRPNDSDEGSPELKIEQDGCLDLQQGGSVSVMPLHNSISYCYPGKQDPLSPLPALNSIVQDVEEKSNSLCKTEIKSELSSPVQSSSDSGLADISLDANDQDIACFHCGCEFADTTSLQIHTELHHREEDSQNLTSQDVKTTSKSKTKFHCAICNFHSDRQRTIMEHMRFHTGEVLNCRACSFQTGCDSTLERHVVEAHEDGVIRCPHCAMPAEARVPFIRHYRRCHHSYSCSRCRSIKYCLDPKLLHRKRFEDPSLQNQTKQTGDVLPYLHHNPYARRGSSSGCATITPYAHCNAAMSKVAVSIPPSLQRTASEILIAKAPADHLGERKSRKQTMPRKLLQQEETPVCDTKITNQKGKISKLTRRQKVVVSHRNGRVPRRHSNFLKQAVGKSPSDPCPRNIRKKSRRLQQKRIRASGTKAIRNKEMSKFLARFKRKLLLKRSKVPLFKCLYPAMSPCSTYRDRTSYVCHIFWCTRAKRYSCRTCEEVFRYEYQVLLHCRKEHITNN